MGKGMEPIEQRADLKLRPLKIFIKMRSIHLGHSFRCSKPYKEGAIALPPSQFLSTGPGQLSLFSVPQFIYGANGVHYPSGQLGSALLLLVPPSLLAGGVG